MVKIVLKKCFKIIANASIPPRVKDLLSLPISCGMSNSLLMFAYKHPLLKCIVVYLLNALPVEPCLKVHIYSIFILVMIKYYLICIDKYTLLFFSMYVLIFLQLFLSFCLYFGIYFY